MEDEYQKGYRQGFLDGFHAARDNQELMSPNIPIPKNEYKGCHICGIDFTKAAWGYVCYQSNCPTRITSAVK